jgi:hypothetical protein
VALSIRTGIPFTTLAAEDDRVLSTYLDLLAEADERSR